MFQHLWVRHRLIDEEFSREGIISSVDNEFYIPNKRHLKVLNKGAKSWNRWRELNYTIVPKLADAKPKEIYLDEINLRNADLKGSFFEDKSLNSSDLRGADLRGANLSSVNLICSDLSEADISGANLTKANLTEANLQGTNLSEAILVDTILCHADLGTANLSNADLTYADMRGANLNEANLEYAILKYCYVYGVSIWNINVNKTVQEKLSVCPNKTKLIYVDHLENAQLKWLELHSSKSSKISKYLAELQMAISRN